jgi:hypothetical protein
MSEQTQTKLPTVTFADAGIDVPHDDTERTALVDGTVFVALKVEVRPSKKYGEYVVFDGENLEGEPFHAYSASGVVLGQAKTMLLKYGDEDGTLKSAILCAVVSKVSTTTGRTFLSLA